MKATFFFIAGSIVVLSACSFTKIKETVTEPEVKTDTSIETVDISELISDNPPMERSKYGKSLNLVRMMEGGACKNDQEGVNGIFLLYAYAGDIERIKKQRGSEIFADFESSIVSFSTAALQFAVDHTNFSLNPFALDEADAKLKVANQFLLEFEKAIQPEILKFEERTSLTIDLVPFFSTLIFFNENCDATHIHQYVDE